MKIAGKVSKHAGKKETMFWSSDPPYIVGGVHIVPLLSNCKLLEGKGDTFSANSREWVWGKIQFSSIKMGVYGRINK